MSDYPELREEYDDPNTSAERRQALIAFLDELENYGGDQATLIPAREFEDHARDLAEDIGDPPNDSWPYTCIDWERAARELAQDYTMLSFDGIDYYVR